MVFLHSCTKDIDEPQEENEIILIPPDSVGIWAGVFDSTFVFHDINPDYVVPITWDAQNLYGAGTGSLDIDLNGSQDFFLDVTTFNWDSIHLVTGSTPTQMSRCYVSTSQEFEFVSQRISYSISVGGHYSSVHYVDRFDYQEWIDSISAWESNKEMWSENPYGNWAPGVSPIGYWGIADTIYYMAIRKNGQQLGWIEVDATNRDSVLYKSCAIKMD